MPTSWLRVGLCHLQLRDSSSTQPPGEGEPWGRRPGWGSGAKRLGTLPGLTGLWVAHPQSGDNSAPWSPAEAAESWGAPHLLGASGRSLISLLSVSSVSSSAK